MKKIVAAGMILLFLGSAGLVWAKQHSPLKKVKGKKSHKSTGSSTQEDKLGKVEGLEGGSEVPVDPKSGRPKGEGTPKLGKIVISKGSSAPADTNVAVDRPADLENLQTR
jgi:hypothetical protein